MTKQPLPPSTVANYVTIIGCKQGKVTEAGKEPSVQATGEKRVEAACMKGGRYWIGSLSVSRVES